MRLASVKPQTQDNTCGTCSCFARGFSAVVQGKRALGERYSLLLREGSGVHEVDEECLVPRGGYLGEKVKSEAYKERVLISQTFGYVWPAAFWTSSQDTSFTGWRVHVTVIDILLLDNINKGRFFPPQHLSVSPRRWSEPGEWHPAHRAASDGSPSLPACMKTIIWRTLL